MSLQISSSHSLYTETFCWYHKWAIWRRVFHGAGGGGSVCMHTIWGGGANLSSQNFAKNSSPLPPCPFLPSYRCCGSPGWLFMTIPSKDNGFSWPSTFEEQEIPWPSPVIMCPHLQPAVMNGHPSPHPLKRVKNNPHPLTQLPLLVMNTMQPIPAAMYTWMHIYRPCISQCLYVWPLCSDLIFRNRVLHVRICKLWGYFIFDNIKNNIE